MNRRIGVGESYQEKADTRVGVAEWQWENGNRKVGESEPTRLLYSIRSLFSYSNSPTATRSFLFIYSDVLNDKTCLQMMADDEDDEIDEDDEGDEDEMDKYPRRCGRE